MDEGAYPAASEAPENIFRSVTEAEVSLDEMLSLACRQGKQDIVELLLESGANVNHRNKAGNTPLLEACSQGHVSIAKLLLDRNADIDAPTETTYDSALTWACTLGNVEIVRLLLDRKASVEHRTKDGCTALMFAALAGHEKVAKLLLDHKAKINVESDSNKDSPLTFACWKGHERVVKLFLERKADIEHRTKEGFSPLMFAALGGHTQVAELLLKHKAEVNNPSGSNNDIPLTSACWKGHHQVVYLLLQHKSDIEHRTKDGCTPLMLAAREGHLSVAQLLLRHGAKVNVPSGSENNIPLTLACWKGHRDVVELLLKCRSNIEHQNKAGCTPLMLAAREGHLEATQLLLNSGAQINISSGSNDDTPLTLACWKGHEDVVQLLINRGSSVNHQTKTGCTPLMEATREGHVGVAKILLEAQADVETPDNYGQSPFFMACWKGHADVAALLLEYDANKDCRTKTGITPLFQACRENHVDVVKLLLDYGCNPSTPFPNSRECPLTLAAEKGYVELAQLLLSRSANVEARTKKGCSPFYLACKEGFKEIAVMLAKHGSSTEAVDQRGSTPLLAAYRNGHIEVVEWLLAHVSHLPSDSECQKAFVAPTPADTDLLPQRSKCLELIMKAKKAREQAALKNAQSLFEEIDAEKEKIESKKKAAAKKRNKRKERKRKEQAEKTDTQVSLQVPVEGQEDPDEGEELATPIGTPPSNQEAPPPSNATTSKKRSSRKNKKNKTRNQVLPEATATPAPPSSTNDWSDSCDELDFYDAQSDFPDFRLSVPDGKDGHNSVVSSSRTSPAVREEEDPVPTAINEDKPILTSNSKTYNKSSKQRTPQVRPEASPPSITTLPSRERQSGVSGVHEERSDNSKKAADSDSNKSPPSVAGQDKTKSTSGGKGRKSDKGKEGVKNRLKIDKEHAQNKAPPTIANVATRGAPSSATPTSTVTTTTAKKVQPDLQRSFQPRPATQQATTTTSSSSREKKPTKNQRNREKENEGLKPATKKAPSVSTPSTDVSKERDSSDDQGWIKATHSRNSTMTSSSQQTSTTSSLPLSQAGGHVTSRTNQKSSSSLLSSKVSGENAWNVSSQESTSGWGSEGYDLEEQLLLSSECTTDDDKIRSRLKAAAAQSSSSLPMSRPVSTSALPTPTTTTTTTTSHSWHEVTRTTRTVQLTVSNALVGRIIGRGGMKINSIQDMSGAHINVSRNIPKSTERLITIRGTQRSITKAQDLIDEALSTPDNTLEFTVPSPSPSPDGGPKITSSCTTTTTTYSDSPVTMTTSCTKKKYSDIIPSKTPPTTTTPTTTTVSEASRYIPTETISSRYNNTCVPSTDDMKSVPASRMSPRSTHSSTGPRSKAWSVETGVTSFASVAAGSSPHHGANTTTVMGQRSPILAAQQDELSQSVSDSEEERDRDTQRPNSSQGRRPRQTPSAVVSVTPEPKAVSTASDELDVDMSSEFPPLGKHSRSKSDPQVSSADQQDKPDSETSQTSDCYTQSLTSAQDTQQLSSSLDLPPSPNEESHPPPRESRSASGPEKLPCYSSTTSPEKSLSDGVRHSAPVVSTIESVSSSLAVGGDTSTKTTKSVAVIQPTKHHSSLPNVFPAMTHTSSSSSVSDIQTEPLHSTGGNYGAIGPPVRRSSMPSSGNIPPNMRKITRAHLNWSGPTRPYTSTPLENVGENDPFNPSPSLLPHPPTSSLPTHHTWLSNVNEGERGRSYSWAGLHPMQPSFIPSTTPQPHPMNFAPNHHHHPPHQQPHPHHSDDPFVPPSTPDTPHGENHPIGDDVIPPMGGVYGPIGSNMPTNRNSGSSVIGSNRSFRHHDSSPLSSPVLPRHSYADTWYGNTPNVAHQAPPSISGGHRHGSSHQMMPGGGKPFMGGGIGTAPSLIRGPSPIHKAVGAHGNLAMSFDYPQSSIGDDPHISSGRPKRWSVPSFPYNSPPPFHDSQPWGHPFHNQGGPGGVHIHGRNSVVETSSRINPHRHPGGVSMPASDPWTNLSTPPMGPGFPSPPQPSKFFHNSSESSSVPHSIESPGPRFGRSLSASSEQTWGVGSSVKSGEEGELQQLMKSLDIGDEHMRTLKARKLSLQQLHSMSDEEWRSLKLPVGPRVKLMNAISNIAKTTKPNSPTEDPFVTSSANSLAFSATPTSMTSSGENPLTPGTFQ